MYDCHSLHRRVIGCGCICAFESTECVYVCAAYMYFYHVNIITMHTTATAHEKMKNSRYRPLTLSLFPSRSLFPALSGGESGLLPLEQQYKHILSIPDFFSFVSLVASSHFIHRTYCGVLRWTDNTATRCDTLRPFCPFCHVYVWFFSFSLCLAVIVFRLFSLSLRFAKKPIHAHASAYT